MRPHDNEMLRVLRDGVTREVVVDVFHGSDRVMPDLRFTDWSLSWDLGANVKASGSGTVVHESRNGESLVPEGTNGVLSPYRARLAVSMIVSARSFRRKVQLGWFPIKRVPTARTSRVSLHGREIVVASLVDTDLESLDAGVAAAGFTAPNQPPSTSSAYAELRRIGLLPVRETLDDFSFPSGFTWEARQGGRLDAVHDVAQVAGRVPVVDWAGMWVMVPDEPAEEAVAELWLGEHGTVIDIVDMVDTEGVYNEVVGIFETETGEPIVVEPARILTGPLSVARWGAHTRYYSSPLVRTAEAARIALDSILALSSGAQLYDIPITCIVNPLIEIGDTVDVVGHARPLRGLVRQVRMNGGPTMDLILRVKVPL